MAGLAGSPPSMSERSCFDLAGIASLHFLGQRGVYLEDLFVVPEWRGHGLGRQLLARLAAIALARDCGRLEWSVLDWNTPAIGFYRRLGAVPMDDWTIFRVTGESLQRLAAQ